MNAYETARQIAQVLLKAEQTPTAALIREKVAMAIAMLRSQGTADDLDEGRLVRELESLYTIWIGQGTILDDEQDHVPWLPERRASINWDFWNRYRRYLEEDKGWSPRTADRLEQLTDSVLERLEDPKRAGSWDRRGMVVGQVQSGKTSNYTGLICKAVDAGYKLIVVLAGLHNSLRSQTQLRLDEGFLGFDSQLQRRALDEANAFMGVGRIPTEKFLVANSGTSSAEKGDFSTKVANQCGIVPGGSDPVLMVVKKNKTVLKNLVKWALSLRGVPDPTSGRKIIRDVPLLIIDDEADNASINTEPVALDENGKPDENQDPTAINGLIRELLSSFEKSAYVGYTATPFANIFIHPQVEIKRYGEDLFPRHFIINLPAPSNYVGPVQVFGLSADSVADLDEIKGLKIVRTVKDQDEWMPLKHKKDHVPSHLPLSLKKAIRAFVLTCAVRIWRGQETAHNSMLVHVTRFTAVQEIVAQLVQDELTALQRRLRYGDGNAPDRALDEFKNLWNGDYAPTSTAIVGTELQPEGTIPSWEEISPILNQAASRIQVKKINGTAKDILDYWDNPNGLNVIAIGGDKLSRGLTLEGLSISYYLRASKMYDTLMQMGRWFGYRPGYLDLCRLYTTDELVEWYRHITVASEELRKEFDRMADMRATPEEFGLKVRTHPAGLIITGANKMRTGIEMELSYAGSLSETTIFYKDENINLSNYQATEDLLRELGEPDSNREGGNYFWSNKPAEKIIDFLANYKSHEKCRTANTRILVDYIQAQLDIDELISWTVVLISNTRTEDIYSILGYEVGLTERGDISEEPEAIQEYRLSKSHILSPTDEWLDLSPQIRQEIVEETRREREKRAANKEKKPGNSITPSGPILRDKRDARHGLLILYPLSTKKVKHTNFAFPIIGFVISFPGSDNAKRIKYKVNNIYYKQEFEQL